MLERESKTLEYKEDISKSYLKTVSAYANYGDGIIIFGVTDDHVIKGILNPHKACLNIENQINDSIKPRPDFALRINSDNTIALSVSKGLQTPYRYNGKCYKRNDSATVEVDTLSENRLVLEGMNLSYEELVARQQNLTFEALGRSLKEKLGLNSFNQDTLKSLNLLGQNGYNNAASLLADVNDFPGLDIIVFGSNINEIKKRRTLAGISVLEQYLEALQIFEEEYIVERIDGGFREKYERVPFEAFREALANSIIHRVWDNKINTKIEMHADKIVVSSPGGLTPMMSKEVFLQGKYSCLRNPILAGVFHRLNIVEIFATGIRRINDSYKDFGQKPVFDVGDSFISVTLPTKKKIILNSSEKKVFSEMNDNYDYSRLELEELTGLSKDSVIRALAVLDKKGLAIKSGKASQTRYRKASPTH